VKKQCTPEDVGRSVQIGGDARLVLKLWRLWAECAAVWRVLQVLIEDFDQDRGSMHLMWALQRLHASVFPLEQTLAGARASSLVIYQLLTREPRTLHIRLPSAPTHTPMTPESRRCWPMSEVVPRR